jgi:hypothetical protein
VPDQDRVLEPEVVDDPLDRVGVALDRDLAAEPRDAGEARQVERVHRPVLVEVRGEPLVVGRGDAEPRDEQEGPLARLTDRAHPDVGAVDRDPVHLHRDVGVLGLGELAGRVRPGCLAFVVHVGLLRSGGRPGYPAAVRTGDDDVVSR